MLLPHTIYNSIFNSSLSALERQIVLSAKSSNDGFTNYKHSPIVRSVIKTFCDNVIGTGLSARSTITPNGTSLQKNMVEQWKANIDARFSQWTKKTLWNEKQYLVYKSFKIKGIALLFLLSLPNGQLQVRVADTAIIDSSLTFPAHNIFNGIELNAFGEIQGLFLRNSDVYSQKRKYIKRKSKGGKLNFIILTEPDVAGEIQAGGIIEGVSQSTINITSFLESMIHAAKIHASILGTVKTESSLPANMFIGSQNIKKNKEDMQLSQSGTMTKLQQGESVEMFDTNKNIPAIKDFLHSAAEIIGMHVGLPSSIILKRFEKSYSASRAEIQEAWKSFTKDRNLFIDMVSYTVYSEWLYREVMIGLVDAPNFKEQREEYSKVSFQGSAQPSLDPVKEAVSFEKMLSMGIVSKDTVAKKYGINLDEEQEKITKESINATRDT